MARVTRCSLAQHHRKLASIWFYDRAIVALSSGKIVLETDDVVLAEIAAGLDLDEFELDPARIGEPVNTADRDIGRLVSDSMVVAPSMVTSAVPRTTTQCSAR